MPPEDSLTCTRCGTAFDRATPHTEIVRRDFVEVPEPATIDHLCRDCWEEYMVDFLDAEFEVPAQTPE